MFERLDLSEKFERNVKVILYEMVEQGELVIDCDCSCEGCDCEDCGCDGCDCRLVVTSDF